MKAAAVKVCLPWSLALATSVLLSTLSAGPVALSLSSGWQIGSVEYLDAANFAAKFGWKLHATPAPKRFLIQGPTNVVELEVDSRECTIGGQRVFLGEPVRDYRDRVCLSRVDAERLFTPILRPGFDQTSRPPIRVIAIDPGHGGKDPGNGNARLKIDEKTFALDTAVRLAVLLKKQGYKVVMTRAGDKFIELQERPEIARRLHADLFISLHYNSAAAPTACGVEVFTLTPRDQYSTADTTREDAVGVKFANPGNKFDHWNTLLGYNLHRELLVGLKAPDRGLKRARWAVLRPASCPAVLVESGYLSNEKEARQISTSAYRQQIAVALAKGVSAYAAALTGAKARG